MPESTIIDGECPIYIEMHGNPELPCIVFIQGLGMNVWEWPQNTLKSLTQYFYLVCIENRDAGLSGRCGPDVDNDALSKLVTKDNTKNIPYTLYNMRDDVIKGLTSLGVVNFAIIGFSMGGMIAQLVASLCGNRVTGLVQICSTGGEKDVPVPEESWRRFLKISYPFESQTVLVDQLADDLKWFAEPSPLSNLEARQAAIAMIHNGYTPGGYARQLLALSRSGDRTRYLESIKCPTLVIGALEDRCVAPKSSKRAHKLIPNSELIMCKNIGHTLGPAVMGHMSTWLRKTLLSAFETTARLKKRNDYYGLA